MCRNQTHFFSFSAYFLSANTLSEKTMTLSLRLKKEIAQTTIKKMCIFSQVILQRKIISHRQSYFLQWFDLTFHENESKTAEKREKRFLV